MKKLILISLSLMVSATMSLAQTYTDGNGITWTYENWSETLTITNAEGCGETVVVPGTINGIAVKSLSNTFNGNTTIRNVTVPTSVTSIVNATFNNCSRLLHVEGLSKCTEIGDLAFQNCTSLKTVDLSDCTTIRGYAFYGCTQLTDVGSLAKCKTIESGAFLNCSKLTNVGSLRSLTSVGASAFYECKELATTINLDVFSSIPGWAFYNCPKMTFEGHFAKCTTIGSYAFNSCSSFTDVKIESNVLASIGENALSSAKNIDIKASDLSSIENYAFGNALVFSINTAIPPSLGESVFSDNTTFSLPTALVNTYKTANGWKDYAAHILSNETQIDYDINVNALSSSSAIHAKIGETNLGNVVSLKVSGTINGYDIMIIRNKMPNLHNLNLSDASIVANDYEYHTGHHTEDNVLGDYAFCQLSKLYSVELPQTITSIGMDAFRACQNLQEVIIPEGVTIIQCSAFNSCSSLKKVAFPASLTRIESYAFSNCAIESVSLPISLTSIGWDGFSNNYNLKEIRIPSSIYSIGDRAFANCPNLLDVYTYTIEPTSIDEDTFSTYSKATLHVPSTSFQNYYWDTEWSQFNTLSAFDEPYEYFYINKDYTLDDNSGRIDGEPDADVNPGSGLIVEGNENQDLDDVHVKENDDMGGSIIGDGNINANHLYIDITINMDKWYFMSFPYRIKLSDIVCDGSWVFRYYDGQQRANNGSGGWKDLPTTQTYLDAGKGYIFRCNQNGTLKIPVDKSEYGKFAGGDRQQDMSTYSASGRPEDASWNFLGNPYTSYFDIEETGYDGPITVWNGFGYESVRPGDDDYHLRPFEAFFVQKPSSQNALNYDADGRHTYHQWSDILAKKNKTRLLTRGEAKTRFLVNLELSDGTNSDKARVVFNENCSADYEIGVDASKFMANNVPQIYSIDAKQVCYSINERPEGEVRLGYVATQTGEMTISAMRLDKSVVLYDTETDMHINLANADYTFKTEAGVFNQRFILKMGEGATGISNIKADSNESPIYTLNGVRVDKAKTHQVYIQKGKKRISK